MLGSTLLQGHELVGRHLDVYWPADDSFYEAVVESYNPQNKEPYKVKVESVVIGVSIERLHLALALF